MSGPVTIGDLMRDRRLLPQDAHRSSRPEERNDLARAVRLRHEAERLRSGSALLHRVIDVPRYKDRADLELLPELERGMHAVARTIQADIHQRLRVALAPPRLLLARHFLPCRPPRTRPW